ncbi:PadR family transcriptional regulator [Gordonia sp. (in: high G+C Gram-positive bacteria)]|uniref:PadR family transcriptional regulator n=1 Tax=Gordonia sp. (in: high G+C Gram-positive bacteria) TaxID=84139 RepID=UPI0039E6410C
MALEHAIMVSLAERPGTGYEIAQQFDRSIGHFWSATHQQVYRTLKKLHVDGLVDFEPVVQDGRPDKKVYQLSDAGREALAKWVSTPTAVTPLRNELGVKIRGAEHGDLASIILELEQYRDSNRQLLEFYRSSAAQDFPNPDALTGRKLHQYLVLRGGIRAATSVVEWCDEVIDGLANELSAQ